MDLICDGSFRFGLGFLVFHHRPWFFFFGLTRGFFHIRLGYRLFWDRIRADSQSKRDEIVLVIPEGDPHRDIGQNPSLLLTGSAAPNRRTRILLRVAVIGRAFAPRAEGGR